MQITKEVIFEKGGKFESAFITGNYFDFGKSIDEYRVHNNLVGWCIQKVIS